MAKHMGRNLRVMFMALFLIFAVSGIVTAFNAKEVHAAAGFKTVDGTTYYIKSNGAKARGWLTVNGKRYYFDGTTGAQKSGWLYAGTAKYYLVESSKPEGRYALSGLKTNSAGVTRYFDTTTYKMATGWTTINGYKYFFDKKTGIMKTGWLYSGTNKYYLSKTKATLGQMTQSAFLYDKSRSIYRYFDASGKMVRGWYTFGSHKRYFRDGSDDSAYDGAMVTGFYKISGSTYYFLTTAKYRGVRASGWVTIETTGNQYYMDASNGGAMVVSTTKTINGTKYTFDANGVATVYSSVSISSPSGSKTIKNYLLGALQPVGKALYVWGGGWNDSTRKGISSTWVSWYNSQSSSYDYTNYNDLSTTNRAKGLDCSGFVGWAAYQVMHTTSGVGSGYTVVSGSIGSYYRSLGWGSIITQSTLASTNYKLYPGDVGYNDGHTWIVLGQCSDNSIVIVHSTPQAGCQISGTPTPSGSYSSEAITLAKKYMSKYSGYTKYSYHTSSGNYVRNGNFLRWNSSTLSDPDGYKNMTAAQILYDIFGY